MTKHNLAPDFIFEPDYDGTDAEHDDAAQVDYEAGADVDYDPPTDPEYEDAAQADYEQAADPEYDDVVAEPAEPAALPIAAPPVRGLTAAPGFAFELGWPVLPLTQEQPHPVVWRGHLKERHPATGLVYRVPVYRLADGHWDCYREEELQVA